jgi:hypothetical protein
MPLTPGQIAAHQASKADVSANWRVKGKYHDPTGNIEVHSPSKHHAVPAESPPPGPIMTIDEFMEKFSSPPGKVCTIMHRGRLEADDQNNDKTITVKAPPSLEPVEAPAVKPASKSKAKVAPATPAPKAKPPLGERNTNMSPPPVPAAKVVDPKKAAPKGTPGAGRLLKKPHNPAVAQTKPAVAAKPATKLVAISENATA